MKMREKISELKDKCTCEREVNQKLSTNGVKSSSRLQYDKTNGWNRFVWRISWEVQIQSYGTAWLTITCPGVQSRGRQMTTRRSSWIQNWCSCTRLCRRRPEVTRKPLYGQFRMQTEPDDMVSLNRSKNSSKGQGSWYSSSWPDAERQPRCWNLAARHKFTLSLGALSALCAILWRQIGCCRSRWRQLHTTQD